jgi:protein-tyrosine phosphatase
MFRVLFVCTANICRSPMAEHLMRAGLEARLGQRSEEFLIGSAGTFGLVGEPIDGLAGETLRGHYDLDGAAFRARALDEPLVRESDLVLTACREHRAVAVTLQPQAARRTFTIREFDRLLSAVDPASLPTGDLGERARAVVTAAGAQRGLVRPDRPGDDDVMDPYRGPRTGYVACAALLQATLQRPLDLLAG